MATYRRQGSRKHNLTSKSNRQVLIQIEPINLVDTWVYEQEKALL